MAALTQEQVRLLFTEGGGGRKWTLFALLGVSGNDTVDLAALGFFRGVNAAVIMGTAGQSLGGVGLPGGAVIAIPSGLANASAYILVDGIPL